MIRGFQSGRMLAIVAVAVMVPGGCAEMPTGPTVVVWPAPGKPFDVFRQEDVYCRQYAASIVNPHAVNRAAAGNVAVTTAAGAAAGALIGGSSGAAGVGAGTGLIIGGAAASDTGARGSWTAQRQYNVAYEQCMYAKGNQIPGAPTPRAYVPPPPPASG